VAVVTYFAGGLAYKINEVIHCQHSPTYIMPVPDMSNSKCMQDRSESGLCSSLWTATLTLQQKIQQLHCSMLSKK